MKYLDLLKDLNQWINDRQITSNIIIRKLSHLVLSKGKKVIYENIQVI